jgi:dihydropteroate synthase
MIDPHVLRIGDRPLPVGERTLVMGVVNVTPDSFSDGGRHLEPEAAVRHGLRLVEEGADLLDVGGESTRPGAAGVSAEEQVRRVVPVIRELASAVDVPISVDTRSAAVAREALQAGASVVNDVSGLRHDPGMAGVCAEHGCAVVLMHMRGTPADMRERTDYDDVVADVVAELRGAMDAAVAAGVDPERIAVDPGIGFAKTAAQSFRLVADLGALAALGRPVVLGVSRKSFLGSVLDVPPEERLLGTAAAIVAGILAGARIVRVHDVRPTVQVARVADAIRHARGGPVPCSPTA